MSLAAGDMCVIVDHPSIGRESRQYIGRLVVLVCVSSCALCEQNFPNLRPFWKVAGMPDVDTHIAEVCLRRIPPAPFEIEAHEECEA